MKLNYLEKEKNNIEGSTQTKKINIDLEK